MLAQAEKIGLPIFIPSPRLCTDNAAMIAGAAYFKLVGESSCHKEDFHLSKKSLPMGWSPAYLNLDAKATLSLFEE